VDRGSVFEHDCLPHPDFFPYCQALLDKYQDNDQVRFIGGNNFQNGIVRGKASYYFSALPHIWGWATWKSTWELYQYNIRSIPFKTINRTLHAYFDDRSIRLHWLRLFLLTQRGKIATWDYQLTLAIWMHQGLAIVPNTNLVTNIGYGQGAIHCLEEIDGISNVPAQPILPLIHPATIERDREADRYFSYQYDYRVCWRKIVRTLKKRFQHV
jgi:hypothetical protein